jgi:cyclic pyranopterin phosphate synthase
MPESVKWLDRTEILDFEEIYHIVEIMAEIGIEKIRLTGGEPLLRRELHKLVGMLSEIKSIKDIALTTNGYLLSEQAKILKDSGLKRINISLDTLDHRKFRSIARRDFYKKVIDGIFTARDVGFEPIKINVVVIRGVNDDEVVKFAEFGRENGFVVRFIEFMPIDGENSWRPELVVPSDEIVNRISSELIPLVPYGDNLNEPAERFRFIDGKGEIGVISSVSKPFCSNCNRIRLTADGKLKTCLFGLVEYDLKSMVRSGVGRNKIKEFIISAVHNKESGHKINQPDFVKPSRLMWQIGG